VDSGLVVSHGAAGALLAGLVDYAGLFPPAALSMDAAVAEYARWRASPEAFMLGRFVAPAARLDELGRAAEPRLPRSTGKGEPWRVSALVADPQRDVARIESFGISHAGEAIVDSVELKAATAAQADALLAALPHGLTAYVEIAPDATLPEMLEALKRRGARAKIRTGGVVPEAIPEPRDVARFIAACASARVPFKATAGLHHPVRAEHALTYEPTAPRAVMHGFVNVFAAAAFARAGAEEARLEAVLRETEPAAFRFDEEALSWRELKASAGELVATRRDLATSFGSCSFAEPVADLRALAVLR
jgi:hypothetical protein